MRRPLAAAIAPLLIASAALAQNVEAPKDARFTIVLLAFEGPGHVRESKAVRERLAALSRMNGFYLVHEENQSALYYGKYSAVSEAENPGEARRAQEDLRKLRAVALENGDRPFDGAVFITMPTPNPEAPPEWDLRNAKGVWALEIGSYRGAADRKQAAVDAVREARRMGLDAYYYHGPTTSSVLVGSFPFESVRAIEGGEARAKPGQELVVLPFKPAEIPDEVIQDNNKEARVVGVRYEIADPLLMDLMKRFPNHAVNGEMVPRVYTDPRTGRITEKFPESFIVDVRAVRRQSILGGGRADPGPGGALSPDAPSPDAAPRRPSTPGGGKLREIK